VSSGHRTWIENEYGQHFDRPVSHVAEWAGTVRRLLGGEALTAPDNAFGISVPASWRRCRVTRLAASQAAPDRDLKAAAGGALAVMFAVVGCTSAPHTAPIAATAPPTPAPATSSPPPPLTGTASVTRRHLLCLQCP
jgi:hypothetical protein